jgi:hypothetical protein
MSSLRPIHIIIHIIIIIISRDGNTQITFEKNNSVIYEPILTYYSHFTPKIKCAHLSTVGGRTTKCDPSDIRLNSSVEMYTIKSNIVGVCLRVEC